MVSSPQGWSNLPKSVKLLDISLVGYIIILSASVVLYLGFLDQTVQNLMPIFLTSILLLFTWNLRTKILKSPDPNLQKQHYYTWLVICLLATIVILIVTLVYPVTY